MLHYVDTDIYCAGKIVGEEYPRIGDDIDDPPPAVFELVVADHVPWVNPASYGLNYDGVNPHDYFVTSGDAVEKAKILDRDLWRLAGDLRKEMFRLIAEEQGCDLSKAQELFRSGTRPINPPRLHDYEAEVWKAAGQCRRLVNALKAAKGVHCFLETEWTCHKLLCIPKNPRK